MSDSQSSSSSDSDSASVAAIDLNVRRSQRSGSGGQPLGPDLPRRWHDVFWLGIFLLHLIGLGLGLAVLGLNRFKKSDRFNLDRFTTGSKGDNKGLTEDYWPMYALAGGVGSVLGFTWLLLLGSRANQMMKIAVHILTTYLAVISVLCFWTEQFFWGVAFAIGAALQFLYVICVIDRLPFTMLVLQKAVKMVWSLPEVMRVAYAFMLVMLLWMGIWSFGAAGVVASSIEDDGRWWLLVVLSVSLFWTGAVLCNTVHVIVSGMVFLVLIHGGREAASMPPNPLMKSIRYAVTTSFGSICYGSLFTAAIRTLRWEIRGLRSKIGKNECLLCCVDFLFHLVETLVRFFNKYAYVQIAVYGKSFNHSARDAWELFQSTGVEALVAYDCSGAVLLMGTLLSGLITGTCAGVWTHIKWNDRVIMVGSSAMLMGMVLVSLLFLMMLIFLLIASGIGSIGMVQFHISLVGSYTKFFAFLGCSKVGYYNCGQLGLDSFLNITSNLHLQPMIHMFIKYPSGCIFIKQMFTIIAIHQISSFMIIAFGSMPLEIFYGPSTDVVDRMQQVKKVTSSASVKIQFINNQMHTF